VDYFLPDKDVLPTVLFLLGDAVIEEALTVLQLKLISCQNQGPAIRRDLELALLDCLILGPATRRRPSAGPGGTYVAHPARRHAWARREARVTRCCAGLYIGTPGVARTPDRRIRNPTIQPYQAPLYT